MPSTTSAKKKSARQRGSARRRGKSSNGGDDKPSFDAFRTGGATPGGPSAGGDDSGTPDYLIPKMGQYPVADTAYYTTITLTRMDPPTRDSSTKPLSGALDPVAAAGTPPHATAPAQGVILTHAQDWRLRGLALGNLLHSLCLAPGEVTKVAMVDWHRQTRATGSETVDQTEELVHSGFQNRSISEVQNAVARETQHGSSRTRSGSASHQAGVGGVMGLFGVSGSSGANLTSASSVSFSTGVREISATSSQRIHQRTEELAQASRSRRATIVKEVSESESETLTTRVVANYNHMHALTMQYYEVLEIYLLQTRVVDAERCLFLPMQVIDFGERPEIIDRYREVLAEAADAANMPEVREALLRDKHDEPEEDGKLEELRKAASERKAEHDDDAEKQEVIRGDLAATDRALRQIEETMKNATRNPLKFLGVLPQLNAQFVTTRKRKAELTAQLRKQSAKTAAAHAAWTAAVAAVDLAEKAAKVSEQRLINLLNRHRLYFNQRIWLDLDPFIVAQLLADKRYDDERLAGSVDPEPVAVFGNYLGFRWEFPPDKQAEADAFAKEHTGNGEAVHESIVAMPTGGVFAEAVPGQSNCAEKVDVTRFWKWQDSPIPILPPNISPLEASSRARPVDATPGELQASAAQLRGPAALPDPSGSGTILQALVVGNLFRDMSGRDVIGPLAQAALQSSAAGAKDAAAKANENFKQYLGFLKEIAPLAEAYLTGGAGKSATMLGGMLNTATAGQGGDSRKTAARAGAASRRPAARAPRVT